MINILKPLMNKVENIQEHMGNISREMQILRKEAKVNVMNQKHCNLNEAQAHEQTRHG